MTSFNFQAGEYFALSAIMLGASMIFVLLSIFYYDYVPEGTFVDNPNDEELEVKSEKPETGEENPSMALEEKTEEEETEHSF